MLKLKLYGVRNLVSYPADGTGVLLYSRSYILSHDYPNPACRNYGTNR
jgi:hypothetical protein